MTKVGEGNQPPKQPTDQLFHRALDQNILRFENALGSYQYAETDDDRARLMDIMSQQMALINSNVREIKRLGIQKQGEVVVSDFDRYHSSQTPENLTALTQDLSTLKEYNYLP